MKRLFLKKFLPLNIDHSIIFVFSSILQLVQFQFSMSWRDFQIDSDKMALIQIFDNHCKFFSLKANQNAGLTACMNSETCLIESCYLVVCEFDNQCFYGILY